MKSARRLQAAGQTLLRAFLLLPLALPSAAQISGSVQTTLPTGAVQGNIYASKTQVFFSAGPQNQKASGLPETASRPWTASCCESTCRLAALALAPDSLLLR